MTFLELIDEVKKIKSEQRRTANPDFYEMVIEWTELASLTKVLKSFFGEPLKKVDAWPNEEIQTLTAPYGGIRQNQTLYYHVKEKEFHMVMLWPWSDGMLITVKIIRGEAVSSQALPVNRDAKSFWEKLRSMFSQEHEAE